MYTVISAWIRFLRLPNVLSVPGDVWVGAVVMSRLPHDVLREILAVCLAYVFGMALNDCVDVYRDRIHRPERPLPSDQISMTAARLACVGLALGSFLLLPAVSLVILLGLIVFYTLVKEQFTLFGLLGMAGCRVCAVWIGAGAPSQPSPALGLVGCVWFLYIVVVTGLARSEGKSSAKSSLAYLPVLWSVGTGWVVVQLFGFAGGTLVVGCVLLGLTTKLAWKIQHAGRVHPAWIGEYIRLLFPLQAMVLIAADQLLWAGIVLAMWPIMWGIGRFIPAS
jgi:4-hydroxybenzoate polyprenyltransferase